MPLELARVASAAPTLSVAQVYRDHVADVTRWVSRLGGPRVDLEDLVQEVFTLVQRHLPSYRGEAQLTTWLFQIAANVVRHQRRRERWRGLLGRVPHLADSVADESAAGADEQVQRREARDLVYRALDRMKERPRTALILFEIEDLPGERVAELMGITAANLWVILHRARAELATQVKALAGEDH